MVIIMYYYTIIIIIIFIIIIMSAHGKRWRQGALFRLPFSSFAYYLAGPPLHTGGDCLIMLCRAHEDGASAHNSCVVSGSSHGLRAERS
jgi:hypothetical protein